MNRPYLVAADVRRLTLSEGGRRENDQSLVTSAATLDLGSWAQFTSENSEVRALHEPTLRYAGSLVTMA